MTLLKMQIGPVQDFIAQARSTRDLWSGSYLLSWLVASGLNCLIQKGKEAPFSEAQLKNCVIFPCLESQPIMQYLKPSLFPPANAGGASDRNDEMLTPNLTNLFLVELPLDAIRTTELAREIEAAIRAEWEAIAEKCWGFGADLLQQSDKARFDRQVKSLLQISWQVTPAISADDARGALAALPLSDELRKTIATAADTDLPFAATLARNAWQLDAVRQVRNFKGWRDANQSTGQHNEKDSLTGREEQIAGGHDWWTDRVKPQAMWRTLFRERQAGEYFGAITFIKRVWHLAYLEPVHGLKAGHRKESHGKHKQFPFPSTLHIASHDPAKNEDEPGALLPEEAPEQPKYFAVLTMDGDEMGKWMSGEK